MASVNAGVYGNLIRVVRVPDDSMASVWIDCLEWYGKEDGGDVF